MAKTLLNYLQNGRTSFYFRRAIPVDLRPLFGQRELYWSLSTLKRDLAQWRCLQSTTFANGLLEVCTLQPDAWSLLGIQHAIDSHKTLVRRQQPMLHIWPGFEDASCIITDTTSTQAVNMTTLQPINAQYKAELHAWLQPFVTDTVTNFDHAIYSDDGAASLHDLSTLRDALQLYLNSGMHRHVFDPTSPGIGPLYEDVWNACPKPEGADGTTLKRYVTMEFTRAFLAAVEGNIAIAKGEFSALSWHTEPSLAPAAKTAVPSITVLDAWKEYCEDKRGDWKGLATEPQYQSYIDEFCDPQLVGNKTLHALTRDDIIRYRNTLEKIPPSRTKLKAYRGKSINELLALDLPRAQCLSDKSIRERLSLLASFLEWCRTVKEYLDKDITAQTRRKDIEQKQRVPFSTSDIARLFDPEHYRPRQINLPYKFWIPLMGLYSGARISELAQLRVDDIRQESNTWVFRVTDSGEGQQVKTKSATRNVPLHKDLVALGLLEYVEELRQRNIDRVFWDCTAGTVRAGVNVSKWFTRFRRERGVEDLDTDGNEKVFHSFRHGATSKLLESGLSKDQTTELRLAQQLIGHGSQGKFGATGTYLHGHTVEHRKAAVDRFDFELDLEKLYKNWLEVRAATELQPHNSTANDTKWD